jgi:integrative and conjugative element protein (TIGR02256 family)
MLKIDIHGFLQKIIISNEVLETFHKSRQIKKAQKEVGGQLFAKISQKEITIIKTYLPNRRDKRTYYSFLPNRKKQMEEIYLSFSHGLHYVGDWHTHPEEFPTPSYIDLESMKECFSKSKHELNNFMLIIVGNSDKYLNLWIGLINNHEIISHKYSYDISIQYNEL